MTRPRIEVRCFSHLGITVSKLDDSVRFYTDVLGFETCYEDVQDEWTRVGLALGDTIVELFSPHPGLSSGAPLDPFYPTEFGKPKVALTVTDVEAAFRQLGEAGISPLCPITSTSMSRFFIVSDPDGTPIQLHEFKGGQPLLAGIFGHSIRRDPRTVDEA